MRFCSYNGVGFVLVPHVDGEMRKIAKKTVFHCIIERIIRGTVKGRVSECSKVCMEVMAYYSRSVIDARCRAVEGPYVGMRIFGAVVNNGAGGIANCSAMLVE